jgi:hypothetical protein
MKSSSRFPRGSQGTDFAQKRSFSKPKKLWISQGKQQGCKSGRHDLNVRPLRPEGKKLTKKPSKILGFLMRATRKS